MARLRIAAGESPLALRNAFMSRLRLVWLKSGHPAADSAVGAARRGGNGGVLRSAACSRVPGAAQREAISAFTRVFDALWRNGALQTPISGLPEIGA
jgi:hypothetical protein